MHAHRENISLEIHRSIARRLLENPEAILRHARENLDRWESQRSDPSFRRIASQWRTLLDTLSPQMLVAFITSPDEKAVQLRQSNPFPGILSPQEVWQIKRNHATSRA